MSDSRKSPQNQTAKPKSKDKVVIFIGEDQSYWGQIQTRFRASYDQLGFKYLSIYQAFEIKDHQQAFLKLYEIEPVIIYIDLSQKMDFHLRLAQYLTRDNKTKQIPVVGLVDSKSLLRECILANLHAIHVKCPEFHDVIYDPMRIAFPKQVLKPNFAKAKCKIDVELYDDCRLGYIGADFVHIEAFFDLEEGQEIELFHSINKSLLPTSKVVVKKKSTVNLYYDYKYAYDLSFKFLEDFKSDESTTGDSQVDKLKSTDLQAKAAKQNHELEMQKVKKKFKQWMQSNIDAKGQKKTKILVIDRTLSILKSAEKPLDKYPYAIRAQSVISSDLAELDTVYPNLIAYHLEEFKDTDPTMSEEVKQYHKELENQSLTNLTNIFNEIKKREKYTPFIVIFNCTKYTSKSFQDSFKYSLILTNKEPTSLDLVLQMADMYEQKQEVKSNQILENKIMALKKENIQKYGRLTIEDLKEHRYFIKKDNPISQAYLTHQASITLISESECVIETTANLVSKSYRVSTPVDMSISIQPDKDTGKLFVDNRGTKTYYGFIHGIGENEKKRLRQVVNEVFFGPINEQRRKEQEEFEKLNQQVYEKKVNSGEIESQVDDNPPDQVQNTPKEDPSKKS